jgi:hypothetical protein
MSNSKSKKITLEKVIVRDDIEIPSWDENEFYGQEIKLTANIRCSGKLLFDRCILIYNPDDIKGKIILEDQAVLTISHCTIIGKSNKIPLDSSGDFLIEGYGKDAVIENTLFYNCRFFASFGYTKTSIENCIIRYTKLPTEIEFFNGQCSSNKMTNCLIENSDLRKKSDDVFLSRYIFNGMSNVSMCTFKNVFGCLYSNNIEGDFFIDCCDFIQCDEVICGYGVELTNCIFEKSENIINVNTNRLKMKSSQFINCKNSLVSVQGGDAEIKGCDIYNYKLDASTNKSTFNFFYIKRSCVRSEISFCTFDGINIGDNAKFINILLEKYPGYPYLIVSNCNFLHCVTKETNKELINTNSLTSGLFGRIKEVEVVNLDDCNGLNRVRKKSVFNWGKSRKFLINHKTSTGEFIGSRLNKFIVGLYGFDVRKF